MTHISTAVWRSAVLAIVLVATSIPANVYAGVFADVAHIFSNTILYTTRGLYNSQTIPLPQAAKNIDPNPSRGGGSITIVNDSALLPPASPSGSVAGTVSDISQKNNGQISVYIVRPGDTLGGIAKMFGVSVNTIRWGNDIKRGVAIQPGQELVILPVTGIKYTVKRGGTLRDIIKTHGGNLKEAVAYNGYGADEYMKAGVEVIIPNGELAVAQTRVQSTQNRYTSRSAPTVRPYNTNGPSYPGYYIRPTAGGFRSQGLHGYNAVDLANNMGAPVFAAASGRIVISKNSGWNGGYGHYIVVQHPNDTQTLYGHLSKTIVSAGQQVAKGQVIGLIGSTGNSTGPHVHFEIRGARNPF